MALFSYDDASRRESLLSILRDVSPVSDNYLVTNLKTSTATNTLHEWVVDNIARPTSVTLASEGADPTYPVHTQPTRSNNITGIVSRPVQVSGTERVVDTATHEDPMMYQKEKALRQLKADMEFVVLNGSKASGASGTARGIAGIHNMISTNATFLGTGASLTADSFENVLQMSWDQVGSAYVADIVLCPIGLKRKISTLTTNVTNYVNETDRLYRNISVYEASTGVVKIIPHKDVKTAVGSAHLYALREEMFRMAFLKGRDLKYEEYAKTGDADKGQYITEFTVESLAERASVKVHGFAQNG